MKLIVMLINGSDNCIIQVTQLTVRIEDKDFKREGFKRMEFTLS